MDNIYQYEHNMLGDDYKLLKIEIKESDQMHAGPPATLKDPDKNGET